MMGRAVVASQQSPSPLLLSLLALGASKPNLIFPGVDLNKMTAMVSGG